MSEHDVHDVHDVEESGIDYAIERMLAKGLSAAAVTNILGVDLEYVQSFDIARGNIISDEDEISIKANQLAIRALDEGLRILDEGSLPARIRLITSIQGHSLRTLRQEQPKELQALQEEMRGLLAEIGIDSSDPESIYGEYAGDDAAFVGQVEVDSAVEEVDDSN